VANRRKEDGKMRRWEKGKTEGWGAPEWGIYRIWIWDSGLWKVEKEQDLD
jgi:hypothetical protein